MFSWGVCRPVIILSAVIVGLLSIRYLMTDYEGTASTMGSLSPQKYKFETVKGFFLQDDAGTAPADFDYQKHNFGLDDREYESDSPGDEHFTQWERFEKYVKHLVKTSPSDVTYKIIYNGRHGEGYHNVGEAKYGTPAWDAHWSKLDGDAELFWFDAHLTDRGTNQALQDNAFIKRQLSEAKMPAPEKYYVSPLYRCLQTANLTFSGLELPAERPFKPVIKELIREVLGEHTCDKRSSKSVIHKAVPDWEFEAGFTEQDEQWLPDHRETFAEHDARTQKLLEDIFEHDSHLVLSFTSHSGAIASLLRVIEHRPFPLPTGGMIPLLVKATKLS